VYMPPTRSSQLSSPDRSTAPLENDDTSAGDNSRGSSAPCARRSGPFGDVVEYTTCVLAYLASSMSVDCATIGIFNKLH
jgi:hypothetical protein